MKKKLFWSMLTVMMTAVLSIGFVACGSDDSNGGNNDGNNGGSSSNPAVVEGTWKGIIDGANMELIFKGNGQGEWIRHEQSSSGQRDYRGVFSYTKESSTRGKAIATIEDKYSGTHTETMYYELKDGKMYIYEAGYGQGSTWILTKEGSSGGSGFNPSTGLYGTWTGYVDGAPMDITLNNNNTGSWVRYEQGSYGTETVRGDFTYVKESETKGYAVIHQGDKDYSLDRTVTAYFELRNGKLYLSLTGYGQNEFELTKK
jgi:hypothetical protein